LRKREREIKSYKNLKVVEGRAICSINPFHLTTGLDVHWHHFPLFSLGEVEFGAALDGPFLYFKYESGSSRKEIDLREFAKDFIFSNKITFGIRVNEDKRYIQDNDYKHFALIALPHDVLPEIESLDEKLRKLGEKIVTAFFVHNPEKSVFIPLEDSILEEVERSLEEELSENSLEKIPIKEIISNNGFFLF